MPHYQMPATVDDLIGRYYSGKLINKPGAVFSYNNADYIVLGRIIETVTGKPYEEVLRARILAQQQEEQAELDSAARKSQIRTMDRSERIRTYNFPENRIADHRTGYKAYNLDAVMDGALDPVIESCILADEEHRIAELGEHA